MGRCIHRQTTLLLPMLLLLGPAPSITQGQEEPEAPQRLGRMITIRGRIDSGQKDRVLEACKQAAQDKVDVLIFDIQGANSDWGSCVDLAVPIVDLGVRRTVAYVSGPLTGHAVLVALACDEIVMHPEAVFGDVYRDEQPRRQQLEAGPYLQIARDTGRDPVIVQGMLDSAMVIHEVLTPADGKRFVAGDQMEEFRRNNRVLEDKIVKEAGSALLLNVQQGRRLGLVQRTAESRREVALMYEVPEQVAAEDGTYGEAFRPILLRLDGTIDNRLYEYVRRRLKQAQNGGHNLLIVEVDSSHGDETAASNIANALASYGEDARVVAWVPRQATGEAVLLLFGCDELVMARDATIGGFKPKGAENGQGAVLADAAVRWAEGSKFPEAAIRGFMDPDVAVYQVQSKDNPNARRLVTADALEDPTVKEQWGTPRPVKEKQVILQMEGERAQTLDVAVGLAGTLQELQSLYNIEGNLPVLQPGWVDSIIQALTSTGGTFFLLFLGFICLYLEFQIPGFGVAGLLSAACFTLFFWSRFLVDQAHSLEVVMFLLGAVFLAVELFVLPGFGFAGISGLVLCVCSLILASQSFTIPSNAEEARALTVNVITLASVLMVAMASIAALSRFFPRMPFLNRLMLGPPEEEDTLPHGLLDDEEPTPYTELLGQRGIAASPLRPAGRMQFAGKFYDVVAKGEFVEQGLPVEVIEVFQNRIIVRNAQDD